MDNYYRDFSSLRINELTVTKTGWFSPYYELTDGQFVYGKLSYTNWSRRKATLEIAGTTWTVIPKGTFSGTVYIHQSDGKMIGEIKPETWSGKISIAINNGFQAIFTAKKVFSRKYTILNDQYGDLITIEPKIWKFSTPFIITFQQNMLKAIPDMPLLILSGIYLALLRQRQAAAAH